MRASRRRSVRAAQAASAALLAALALAIAAPPVVAVPAEDVNAVVNGGAVAWGAYVPADVSPLVELYPVYSDSRITKESSHGISAGFYPGFLVDAAAEFYGFGQEARSTFGVAESLWPNPPQRATAGTSDFGDKCRFMGSDFGFPPSFVTFCSRNWYEYDENLPYEFGSGETYSDELVSMGRGRGTRIRLAQGITAGTVEVNTSTNARDGKSVISEATALLTDIDVTVADLNLKIKELRTLARAYTNGKLAGAKHTREIQINGVFVNGEQARIDETGIYSLEDDGTWKSLNKEFASRGFEIRLVQGGVSKKATTTEAESGSLVLTWAGYAEPEPLREPNTATCDRLTEARKTQEQQFKALIGREYVAEIDESHPNPLKDEDSPAYPLASRDKRILNIFPDNLEAQQPVPPIVPCVVTAMQRNVRTGVALGDAFASARYVPLPKPPDFNFGEDPPDLPPFNGGPVLPPLQPDPPPVLTPETPAPQLAMVPVDYLGEGIGSRLKLVYGGMALAILVVLIGRSAFRALIRL